MAYPPDGTPVLFADQSPCLLCEDFPCITACGTEALIPVEGINHVRMGIALVSHRAPHGEPRLPCLCVEVSDGCPHDGLCVIASFRREGSLCGLWNVRNGL